MSDDLSKVIYHATKKALLDLFSNQESYYYVVLVFIGDGYCPVISAWSHEALARVLENKKEYYNNLLGIKWSYADSPYLNFGSDYFLDVKKAFNQRPSLLELDDDKLEIEYNYRLNSTIKALKTLDNEGIFSLNQKRNKIMINVEEIPPTIDNTIRAKKLNPIESISTWLLECAE